MYYSCIVTLHRRAGEKIVVSPQFADCNEAFDFFHDLLHDFSYFLKFYSSGNRYKYFNDDFILAVEPAEKCQNLKIDTFDSEQELLKSCFEAGIRFMIR